MVETTEIEQRDELIVEAIVGGRSMRAVQREFGLTITELDAALERYFPLDTAARLRTIRGDLSRLDRLIETFYQKALAGDVNSGTLAVKAWERKADLLGLDAVQRIDLQIMRPPEAPTRHEKIRAAIFNMARGPDWKPNDGNGAVGALSPSDDTEPSR